MMLCQNCRKNEVNFHYTQIINGMKKEVALCSQCAKKLGIKTLDFSIPVSFKSMLGDFFNGTREETILPNMMESENLQLLKAISDFNIFDIDMYPEIEEIENIDKQKNIKGIRSTLTSEEKKNVAEDVEKISRKRKTENKKEDKIKELKYKLELAIKEERYEDAARLRDEINHLGTVL